jgi:predicted CXXCH cytochrome family protein
MRCAQCHRDHKGHDAVVRAQDMCADCHRDIHQWSAKAASDNVADFLREHPPFRLSLPDPTLPNQVQRVRQSPGKSIIEHSNLKFNHKAHLDPAGLRTPAGRKRLVCADCHTPNGDGMLMAPVSMKKHCESCHALTFDPAESRRPLPHGPVKLVAETLREFYARQALGRPLPRDTGSGGGAARPGSSILDYQERQNVLEGANRQAQVVLDELFGKRAVCSQCHEVARIPDEPHWTVAPVRLTSVWMPRARFTHAKHSTMRCTACHDIAGSTRAAEVAMPDIGKCRECHVGARAQLGKVTSNCATCHGFHSGAHAWQERTASGGTEAGK